MRNEQGYKFYSWVNTLYMRPIQFGIQAGHLSNEMTIRYLLDPEIVDADAAVHLRDWMTSSDPLYIISDGLCLEVIEKINEQLEQLADYLRLPQHAFFESAGAIGGCMTITGIIVPSEIWSRDTFTRTGIDADGYTTTVILPEYEQYFKGPLDEYIQRTIDRIEDDFEGWDNDIAVKVALHRLCASGRRAV